MIDLEGVSTLADVPRVQARRRGSETALINEGRITTFAEMDSQASRIANRLIAEGVPPQKRIGYLSKNNETFFTFLFGCCKARVVLAPFNFRLSAAEIAYVLEDSGAPLFLVGPDFADLAEAAAARVKTRPKLVALGFERPGFEPYENWILDAGTHDPMLPVETDDDVLQLYTSGTTGLPKGVRLTSGNYISALQLASASEGLNYGAGDAVLGAMPFFHVAGVNIGVIAAANGARTIIVKDFVPDRVLELIEKERVNHAFLAPAIIMMLMQAPKMASADLTSMKGLSYGASPISEDLLVRAKARFNCDFVQFYGMTETTGAATFLPPEAHDPAKGKLRSCGIAWPGIAVKIVGPDGAEAPRGSVGEVVVKAPVVMKGYWNQEEATAEAIRDGWMHTGDVATMDEEGYVFIYDRLKDMIVSGGENIYPAEVENALFGHPDLADLAVIGVPDPNWGEAVKAIVVAKPGAARDPASVIAWAKARIASYKAPKSVDYVEAIPRNATGKILRRELRKPYWEGRDRMIG
jgi:acyl-CoA synthetase (AMP-forming)/AMP-acid ligase II